MTPPDQPASPTARDQAPAAAAGPGPGPRLLFDLSLSQRLCRRRPTGIVRVERQYASHFLGARLAPDGFMTFHRRSRRYIALDRPAVETILQLPEAINAPAPAGASFTDLVGIHARRWVARLHYPLVKNGIFVDALFRRRPVRPTVKHFGASDIYLNVGAPWSTHGQDLDAIATLGRDHGVKLVLMCHDLITVKFGTRFHKPKLIRSYGRFVRWMLAHADMIVCPSQCTAQDVRDYAVEIGVRCPALRVVPHGTGLGSAEARPPPAAGRKISADRFVLSVGTLEPRKNHALLLDVWQRLKETHGDAAPILVLVGGRGWMLESMVNEISRRGLGDKVTTLERVSDAELVWLYRNCRFTVFPSHYEGWGLPVAESLAYGKYCVASTGGAVPEVTQGLVRHLDPEDEEGWRREIERLWFEPDALAALERRIRTQYRPTSWREAGAQLLACVREAAAADAGGASREALPTPGAPAGRSRSAEQATRT